MITAMMTRINVSYNDILNMEFHTVRKIMDVLGEIFGKDSPDKS